MGHIFRRRWFRYSLRTLLGLVTGLCLWLGIVVKRAADQERAIRVLESLNDSDSSLSKPIVFYDRDGVTDVDFFWAGYTYGGEPGKESRVRTCLRDILGEHYVDNVTGVILRVCPNDQLPRVLEALEALPHLRLFSAWNEWRPGSMECLVRLRQIERLHLDIYAWHDDETWEPIPQGASRLSLLSKLPRLRELWLASDALTSDCLQHLGGVAHLETLHLVNLKPGTNGLRDLRRIRALQNLELGTPLIDGDLPDILAELPELKQLTLCKPPDEEIDPTIVSTFKRRLPTLKVVVPSGNPVQFLSVPGSAL